MLGYLVKWNLSPRIKKEVRRIVSQEKRKKITKMCGDKESEKKMLREIKLQKLHAFWFFCEKQYIDYSFFNGEYMLKNFVKGMEMEKESDYVNDMLDSLKEFSEIPKEDSNRLDKIYSLSANRLTNLDESLNKGYVKNFIEETVENYFLEEIPQNFE
jgi:hypothetical protein